MLDYLKDFTTEAKLHIKYTNHTQELTYFKRETGIKESKDNIIFL